MSRRSRIRNPWKLQLLEDRLQPALLAPATANNDVAYTTVNNTVIIDIYQNDTRPSCSQVSSH